MYIVKSPVQGLEVSAGMQEAGREFPSLPEAEEKWQQFKSLLRAIYFCIWNKSS